MTQRIRKVCARCGSHNVTHDALVRWDEDAQQWEMSSLLDSGDCDDCGNDGNGVIVDAQPLTTEDIGKAIIKTLVFDGLVHIDDSDENNLRVITRSGEGFMIRITSGC